MFAVIKTGGKQYRVAPDDVIRIERIAGEAGDEVAFDDVLLLDADGNTTVGAPLIEGATVTGTLLEQPRGEKIIVFKKKRRKNYRRTIGHRQELSVVRITDIAPPGAKKKAAAKKKAPAKKDEATEAAAKDETPKAEAKKTEAKKPAAKKDDAKKADTKKADEKKADTKKADTKKAETKKPAAKKADAKKADEKKTAAKKPAAKSSAKSKAADKAEDKGKGKE